jgi:LuxR family maltose regulon positive regulatory protein
MNRTNSALLLTKITLPPLRSHTIHRARLFSLLPGQPGTRLVLVSAPAGFGKTTFLAEWCRALARQGRAAVAWYSLDEGDNNPARFIAYLITALSQTLGEKVDLRPARDVLQAAPDPEQVLTQLINAVAAIPTGSVLVLDDYHAISSPAVHSIVAFLLDHLPPRMCLAIGGRSDPPLQLSRLRARGQLIEVRAPDLRFTLDEAIEFFHAAIELSLSEQDVQAIDAYAEGWAAGLQLIALTLKHQFPRLEQTNVAEFIARFAGCQRNIFDYLADEVLERQPPDVRRFLLDTAVLDRLSVPLCDAVTGRSDSAVILEQLDRADLFVVPLDEERRWYRYHQIFGQFLRERLLREQPDKAAGLHRRAGEWYEKNGLVAEAIHHALAVSDFERAAWLAEEVADAIWTRGELIVFRDWLEAIPDAVMCDRPRLCIYRALMLLQSGPLNTAELYLDYAEAALEADIEWQVTPSGRLDETRGMLAAVGALLAVSRGDHSRAVESAQQALARLPQENALWRNLAAVGLGAACGLSGRAVEGSRVLAEAAAVAQAAGNLHLALVAIGHLARLQAIQGRLGQAAQTYQQALRLAAEQGGQRLPATAQVYVDFGLLLYEQNDLDAALRRVTEGIELGRRVGNVRAVVPGLLALARTRQVQGDGSGALAAVQEAQQLLREHNLAWLVAPVEAQQAGLWVVQGKLAAAARWAQERGLSADDELSYAREVEHLTLAWVLIAQERPDDALRLLSRMGEAAEKGERMGTVIEVLALRALACEAQDDTFGAFSALERALQLAGPEGYARTFLDKGAPMAELLRRAAARGIAPGYVNKLLAMFGGDEAKRAHFQPLPEPLSERQLEVLRLVAGGASNQEIADTLVITVSTVKVHISRILGKLGVRSRTEAAARARELGLL